MEGIKRFCSLQQDADKAKLRLKPNGDVEGFTITSPISGTEFYCVDLETVETFLCGYKLAMKDFFK